MMIYDRKNILVMSFSPNFRLELIFHHTSPIIPPSILSSIIKRLLIMLAAMREALKIS